MDSHNIEGKLFASVNSLLERERGGVLCAPSQIASQEINQRVCSAVVDWLTDVWKILKLRHESFFAAVSMMRAVLARDRTVTRADVHLYGVASLLLAYKYHEIYPPKINDLVIVIDGAGTAEQILGIERKVFKLLGCNANVPQEDNHWRSIATASALPSGHCEIGLNLLIALSVYSTDFLPSVVATAVARLISSVYQVPYVNHFKIPNEVVEQCAREVITNCRLARISTFKAYEQVGEKRNKGAWLRGFNAVCELDPAPSTVNPSMLGDYSRSTYFWADISLRLLDPPADWDTSPLLGVGGFGSVRKVEHQGKVYAVKKLSRTDLEHEGIDHRFCREISIMQSLSDPGTAQLRYITSDLKSIYMDLGTADLVTWIKQNGPAGKETQVHLALQMFSALSYMHSEGCLHRDIKPGNVLAFEDEDEDSGLRFVLTDFGGGRGCQIPVRDNSFTAGVCTIYYRSPEILLGSRTYNDELDVWSMLCTLYECVTMEVLFRGDLSEVGQMAKIFSVLGISEEMMWPDATEEREYDITMLREYTPSRYPSMIKAKETFFGGDDRLSDCYKEMLSEGLIMDPVHRPRSKEVLEIISNYTSSLH